MKKVEQKDIFLVSLKDIFTCNMPLIKNLTDDKKTNYSINTKDDIEDKIRELLKDKTIEEQIEILKWEIEKLKLRQM